MTSDKDPFDTIKELVDEIEDKYEEAVDEMSEEEDPLSNSPLGKIISGGGSSPFGGENPFDTIFDDLQEKSEEQTSGMGVGLFEINEYDEEVVVVADLPGYKEDQITLTVTDDQRVRISAEADDGMRRESVSQVYSLPCEVDSSEAEADLENGVLTVTLPKTDPDDQTTISIE